LLSSLVEASGSFTDSIGRSLPDILALAQGDRHLGSGERLGNASLKCIACPICEACGPHLTSPKR
ncbi:unnamed protein product, partial [Musa hybrid cultivar]